MIYPLYFSSRIPSEVPDASECVEQFVNFLEKAVQEREFIYDYEVVYPVETDLDLVSQISHDVYPFYTAL